MLRITIHDVPGAQTLQLEGGLAGPWVQEAETCWRQAFLQQDKPLGLDLTAITFIDVAGKAFLAAAHRQGTNLIASGCHMKAIVAEITTANLQPLASSPQAAAVTQCCQQCGNEADGR
jgi:hypothetical protein